MTETKNLGLKKPGSSDIYGDFIPQTFAENMDKLDTAVSELSGKFGGLEFARVSQEEFGAMGAHDPNTVYYVTDGKGGVEQYLSDVKLTGGSSAPTESLVYSDPSPAVLMAEPYVQTTDLTGLAWEQGTYYVDTGKAGSKTNGIRQTDYTALNDNQNAVSVTAVDSNGNDLSWSFCCYDEDKNFISSSTASGWKSGGTICSLGTSSTAKYIRIILQGDSTLTPDMLRSCVLTEYL